VTFSIWNATCLGVNLKLAMREFSVTQDLLNRALEIANSKRIVRVNLLIGPFSEEREESIQFYWKDLAKGSFGEGAELHFDRVNVEMKCFDCTGTFYLDGDEEVSMCKYCYGEHLSVLNGEDVHLEGIELE
jgi:Zn finger protein HypA/HybF involved in hydrogenase expression